MNLIKQLVILSLVGILPQDRVNSIATWLLPENE